MELKGKVALVTGGASGYGREYCKELFRHGCKVRIEYLPVLIKMLTLF